MADPIEAFVDALSGAGLTAPETVTADGKLHRFSTNGKRDDDSGWYVLHDGKLPAGAFGDWRSGLSEKWCAKSESSLTQAERTELKRKVRDARKARDAERKRVQAAAADEARAIWGPATPATEHGYLERKGIQAHGLRLHSDGRLVVPMRDDHGTLHSLQFIDDAGTKLFLAGGRVRGCYFALGPTLGQEPDGGESIASKGGMADEGSAELYVAEGFATAATIAEATGAGVAVSFNAGNLSPVAAALSRKHKLVIAADNDLRNDGSPNVGVEKAIEAAKVASARLVVPELDGAKCDFNDVHAAKGLDEVRRQLEHVYSPPKHTATAQPLAELASSIAPELASNKDILASFRRDVRLRGLVGEIATAQLLYLAFTSRLLDKPVSVGIKGHSSSGKSHTVDRVLEFFPDEAVVKFTSMSERALVYREDGYQHRTLVIYEVTGMKEGREDDMTSYFVRTLLSEGRIEYDVTIRGEDGKYTTQQIVKEGPTNLVFTTTKTRVHGENETRVLSLNTDDGTAQTKAVLAALADEAENTVDLSAWRQFQAWLQQAEHRVTIPYAPSLAEQVPPLAVRLRRDFTAVLALIRSHAILHQETRERDDKGRIVATIADYEAVRELVAPVVSEGIGATVGEAVRETVKAVADLENTEGSTVMDIARRLKLDKSNASRRVRHAADGGYVRNLEDKRGRPGRWVIGEPLPDTVEVLPDPLKLRNTATERNAETRATPSGCAVAQLHEGIYTQDETMSAPISPESAPHPRNSVEWEEI